MTIRTRRIIYLSFIILFLIIAPILIFYARGYRYDLKRRLIQKTGIIFLTTPQKNLSIYINDKLYPLKLNKNLTIKNLLPGEYLIKAEKDGYHPWQKKLTVYSGQSTFTNDIVIFKKEFPLNLTLGKINWLNSSHDKQKIIYLLDKDGEQNLWLLNLENNKSTFLYKLPSVNSYKLESINWAASDKKILINIEGNKEKNFLVLNTERPEEIISFQEFTERGLNYIKWDENSDNILYGIKKNKLYQIDLITKKLTPLLELEISSNDIFGDYLIKEETIYYIKTNKNNSFILKEKIRTEKKAASRIKLTRSLDYNFIEGNNKFLTILDKKKQNLFLINTDFFENISLAEKSENLINYLGAKNALWQPKNNQLLYWNDFEVWIYNLDSNEKWLINRYSEEIKEAIWYPNYQYLVVQLDDKIKILEIDSKEKNVVDLIKLDKVSNLNIDIEGEKLYFIGRIGKQEGLYELELQ